MLLSVCMLPAAYSQNGEKDYYFYTDAQIKENTALNRHNSCQILKIRNSLFFLVL